MHHIAETGSSISRLTTRSRSRRTYISPFLFSLIAICVNPLRFFSVLKVGNAGRVVISAKTIEAWLDHNVEAKRPVMARLAAALQKKALVAAAAAAAEPSPEEAGAVDAGASLPQETRFGPSERQLEPQQQQQQQQLTPMGLLEPEASPPSSLSGAMPAPAPTSAPSLPRTDQGGSGETPGHEAEERKGGGEASNDRDDLGSSSQKEGRRESGEARPPASTATKPTSTSTRSTVPRELRSAVPKGGMSRIRIGGNSRSGDSSGSDSGSAASGATGRGVAGGGAAGGGVRRASTSSTSTSSIVSSSVSSSSLDGVVAPSRIVMPSGRGVRAAGTRASPESGRPRRRRSMAQAEASAAAVEGAGRVVNPG